MSNSLPPSFPMETDFDKKMYVSINKVDEPISEKVPQETKKKRVSVGVGRSRVSENSYYQPHALTIFIDYNRFGGRKFSTKPFIKPTSVKSVKIKDKNKNGQITFFDFMSCTIIIQKETLKIINKIAHKKYYTIKDNEDTDKQIKEIISKKEWESLEVAREFIKIYGGSSEFKILNRLSENKVAGGDVINSIPEDIRFRNEVGKKVYHENNFEFISPALASNFISNQAIRKIAPKLVESIYTINPLRAIKQNCKNLEDIFNLSEFVNLLTMEEKEDLNLWLFAKFG
jgi:hypothetical protein